MFVTKALARLTMFAGLMALPNAIPTVVYAQQAVTVGATDIGGTVVGASGPEAGVWVIAETTELPTKFARIVVTDDQGRYLIPDLPTANYSVWVRGYGLVDSSKLIAKPGQLLNHTAVPAPNEAAAAHYYPAIYWYAMMKIPLAREFGGKSDIPEKLTQTDWLKQMKNIGCIGCHQLGQKAVSGQMALGMFALAVARVIERHRWRPGSPKRPVVPHVNPASPRVGLAASQDRHGRVIRMKTRGRHDVGFNQAKQRIKRRADRPHRVGHGRERDRPPFPERNGEELLGDRRRHALFKARLRHCRWMTPQ